MANKEALRALQQRLAERLQTVRDQAPSRRSDSVRARPRLMWHAVMAMPVPEPPPQVELGCVKARRCFGRKALPR